MEQQELPTVLCLQTGVVQKGTTLVVLPQLILMLQEEQVVPQKATGHLQDPIHKADLVIPLLLLLATAVVHKVAEAEAKEAEAEINLIRPIQLE